jgi:hypothetical protein
VHISSVLHEYYALFSIPRFLIAAIREDSSCLIPRALHESIRVPLQVPLSFSPSLLLSFNVSCSFSFGGSLPG